MNIGRRWEYSYVKTSSSADGSVENYRRIVQQKTLNVDRKDPNKEHVIFTLSSIVSMGTRPARCKLDRIIDGDASTDS